MSAREPIRSINIIAMSPFLLDQEGGSVDHPSCCTSTMLTAPEPTTRSMGATGVVSAPPPKRPVNVQYHHHTHPVGNVNNIPGRNISQQVTAVLRPF